MKEQLRTGEEKVLNKDLFQYDKKKVRVTTKDGAVIQQRNELGITQRDLAMLCGIPQSSVARIESFTTIPNLDTLIKIMRPLGMKLTVAQADA